MFMQVLVFRSSLATVKAAVAVHATQRGRRRKKRRGGRCSYRARAAAYCRRPLQKAQLVGYRSTWYRHYYYSIQEIIFSGLVGSTGTVTPNINIPAPVCERR